MRKVFEERRNYMVERINSINGVSCRKPEGAFYVMMNISLIKGKKIGDKVINTSDDFCELLLEKSLVALVPGSGFGAEGFVRWSYATSMENIKKGLDRLAAANLKNISLTNFDTIVEVAAETGYIQAADKERLIAFRNNPSDESWIKV